MSELPERPEVRISRLTPVVSSPVGRELSQRALMLIGLKLTGADQDVMERYCRAALARVAEIQQSDGPAADGDMPGYLVRLCAFLTEHGSAAGIPREWFRMLDTAERADGAQHHLDISAALPLIDNTAVRIDSLVSQPQSWRVYLRVQPSWWTYSPGRERRWAVMSVDAKDDLGDIYLSQFEGSTSQGDHEELALRFLPRLDPFARTLALTFSGTSEQATLELRLPITA